MTYLGDIALESTFDFKFCTVSTAGVPTTLAGVPVISAYPGNSVTQLTAGITLTVDFDGVTGLHNVRVVATAANGYATATNYALVITTGTVGGASVVGYVVGHISIEARSAIRPTVAARTLDVSATGEAGLDWANIGSPTTAQNLSATNIDPDQVVASVSGAVGSVTGNVGGSVASVTTVNGLAANVITAASMAADASTEIADAVWDEDATGHQTQGTFGQAIGDPGADTDTIWALANTNLDATVSSRLATVGYTAPDNVSIAAILVDTGTDIPATLGTPAGVSISADIAAIEAQTDDIGVAGAGLTALGDTRLANLDATVSSRLASASYTAPPSVASVADGVWDEAIAGHVAAGSTGAALNAAGGAGDPWITAVPGSYIAGQAGFILGTNLDATVSTRASGTALTTVSGLVDDLESRIGTPSNFGSGATVAANLVDIEAQTDDIGIAGAGLTALGDARIANLDAAITTRATPAQVNTEVDTALADVNLDHLVGTATAIPAIVAGTYLDQMMDDGTAVYDRTTDSLQAIRDRGDAAWDTADVSSLATAAALSTLSTTIGTPAGVSVSADIAAIEAQTDDIGVAGAGLTALASAASLTTVSGLVDDLETRLTAVRAGYLDNLSAGAVALQASVDTLEAGVIVTTNNDKTGYALTTGERTSIATSLLTLDLATITGEAARSVLNAIRAIRNRVAVGAGTMTVYEEDDTTAAWTAAITTDAAADPVTQIDPT